MKALLERVKTELNQSVARKEKEYQAVSAKIEDEGTLGNKYQKQIKELQARLEEVGANTSTQVELNKKREAELARIKVELDELNISHEGLLAGMRMKHNNTMSDMGEQIDGLNGAKVKAEKDKAGMERDLADARANLEDGVKAKAELDRTGKLLHGSIVDNHQKLDEIARTLNEADSTKKRLHVENQDLNRQIEEIENAIATTNKNKVSLSTQLEDTKRLGDSEAKDRSNLLTKFKHLSTDLVTLRDKIENTQ